MKTLAAKVLVVGISTSLTLLVLELGCRIVARCCPEPQAYPTAMQYAWMQRHDHRNSLGFRDVEHGPAIRPRLAVVGDSFAFGWGIERLEDRYGEQLASMLGWESVNAALPDTDTLDHIEFLEKVLPLEPRAVVLLYVFNDIDYLSPQPRWPGVPLPLLFNRSHLFQQIAVRVKGFQRNVGGPDGYKDQVILARHVGDLRRFTDRASSRGAAAVVVPFIRVRGDDGQYANLVAAAGEAGVPVWPIDEALSVYELRELTLNALDKHPNEFAYRLAAEASLPYFQQLSTQ